jgi:hypothetical protein
MRGGEVGGHVAEEGWYAGSINGHVSDGIPGFLKRWEYDSVWSSTCACYKSQSQ